MALWRTETMKKVVRFTLILAIAAILATPVLAADKKKGKKKRKPRAFNAVRLPKTIELSAEQKEKVAAINKEFSPKFMELFKKQNTIITPEQRKARSEAVQAARKAGKKGKAFREAVQASFKVDADQKKQLAELGKARRVLQKAVSAKVAEILTADQKAKLKQGRKKGGKKRKKKDSK